MYYMYGIFTYMKTAIYQGIHLFLGFTKNLPSTMDPWIDVNLEGETTCQVLEPTRISGQGSAWKEAENESPTGPKNCCRVLMGFGIFEGEGDNKATLTTN